MVTRPSWIRLDPADGQRLDFVWDDGRVLEQLGAAPAVLAAFMPALSTRAMLGLAVALHEWIVWRFDGHDARPDPRQLVQAGWCATVDPRYFVYTELRREDWSGPVAGPLWCSFAWLASGLARAQRFPGDLMDSVVYLVRLARHVVPAAAGFDDWLAAAGGRLAMASPAGGEDPLEDLFDDRLAWRLGPWVGPSLLTPGAAHHPVADRHFIERQMEEALREGNPFVASPRRLAEAGFMGVPYEVPHLQPASR